MNQILVIGGGITGLAAAWRLQQTAQKSNLSVPVLVLEGSPRVGGTMKTFSREGFLLEGGPDCFISEKPRGIGLCKELGLEQEIIETRPESRRSFILKAGRFYPVPEGFYLMSPSRYGPFLQSELLSWPEKLRVMMEPFIPKRPQTDESLGSFVRRRFGQAALDWLAQPLIAGIYGARPENLSLRATFPRFLEMERTHGSVRQGLKKAAISKASGARYDLFLTLRGGMQRLSDTLAAKLGTSVIRPGTRIKEIRKTEGAWQVVKASGEILTADAVCLALPSYAAAELLQSCDPELAADLAAIAYAPAVTLHMAFRSIDVKRPLDGAGFVVPQKENRLVLGCTLAHNKFEGRAPKGFLLLRAFLAGMDNARWAHDSDEVLTNKVYGELKDCLGITGKPIFAQMDRWPRALPQYNVGHLERVARIEERLLRHKGLTLAGNWKFGVGIPDCIESGEHAADVLLARLLPGGRQVSGAQLA